MALKEFWSQTGRWVRAHNPLAPVAHRPQIGDDGLISHDEESTEHAGNGSQRANAGSHEVVVRAAPQPDRHQSIEKLQDGFDKLVEQLKGINEHLNRQATEHDELMGRIERLPQLLETFPGIVENQKRMTEELLDQLRKASAKNEQFIDAVERIPNETAKQTDALVNIDHQLGAAADVDVQRTESFNKFNDTLDKLNDSTMSQTDGIIRMSKTFAASDRYLKYIMSKQSTRFMWIFIAAISVCLAAILILTGIVIYLKY
ncbi:MAG: hypothetical protein ACYSWO_16660 [Planctomycetota bacterium]|jgi:chromosome segregation ATPase